MPRNNQLWIVLRFPQLSLECLTQETQKALCVHEKQRISMANETALSQGVRLGMSTTQARALLPNLHCLLREQKQEQNVLNALQESLYHITPHIQPLHLPGQGHGEYAIALETSDCLHLFGGWTALLHVLTETMSSPTQGVQYHLGAAHSPMAAWLLTWQPNDPWEKPTQQSIQAQLQSLSIEYLLHYPKIITQLDSMGFTTLGDLFRHIRKTPERQSYSALQKRFGKAFVNYLRSIFDTSQPGIRPWYRETIEFCENIEFDYPLNNLEWLLPSMEKLLRQLSEFLRQHQNKTQLIIWRLSDIEHNSQSLVVRTHKPTNDWVILLELSEIHFSQKSLPFAVDAVELLCRQRLTEEHTTPDLFQHTKQLEQGADLETLSTKLTARLGDQAVYRLSSLDAHLPELTQEKVAPPTPPQKPQETTSPIRPTWLFDTPSPIRHSEKQLFWHGKLKLLRGPERITGQWWVKPEERDYFLAIRDDLVRFWLFYERVEQQWYVQGVFC